MPNIQSEKTQQIYFVRMQTDINARSYNYQATQIAKHINTKKYKRQKLQAEKYINTKKQI